jgi:hypothetical protein
MKPTSAHASGAAAHGHHDPAEMHNEDVAHEHSDINIRAVLGFAAGLVVVTMVVYLLMWGLFVGLEHNAASNDPQLSPLSVPAGQEPAGVRLLTNEPAALREMREAEAKQLDGYGWVNQAAGVAHMPIAEAKKKLLERGLPSRAGEPVDARLGTSAPALGESSGGRILGSRPAAGTPAPPPAPKPAGDPAHKG